MTNRAPSKTAIATAAIAGALRPRDMPRAHASNARPDPAPAISDATLFAFTYPINPPTKVKSP
jgi:hypothetical protein